MLSGAEVSDLPPVSPVIDKAPEKLDKIKIYMLNNRLNNYPGTVTGSLFPDKVLVGDKVPSSLVDKVQQMTEDGNGRDAVSDNVSISRDL